MNKPKRDPQKRLPHHFTCPQIMGIGVILLSIGGLLFINSINDSLKPDLGDNGQCQKAMQHLSNGEPYGELLDVELVPPETADTLQPITRDNLDKLQRLNTIGHGRIVNVAAMPDGTLRVLTTTGMFRQTTPDAEPEHLWDLPANHNFENSWTLFSPDGYYLILYSQSTYDLHPTFIIDTETGELIHE